MVMQSDLLHGHEHGTSMRHVSHELSADSAGPGWKSVDSDQHGLVSWHHYLRTAEDAWLKHDRCGICRWVTAGCCCSPKMLCHQPPCAPITWHRERASELRVEAGKPWRITYAAVFASVARWALPS